ncbi:MAG TPA: YdeI/OmpD-associated family protein [Bacteroidia bacterium]|nr:YdeI/OmpD-associated family protein [Bacteroidia bacterium]
MIEFTTIILKFDRQGEKTGWTYIEIPADVAQQLKRGNKKSFRVKGKLDSYSIKGVALLPMGGGSFIMPLNAGMRKGFGKRHGSVLNVKLEEDKTPLLYDPDLMACLTDEPIAMKFFNNLPPSHKNYFSKWITEAKTAPTKARRIAQALEGLSRSRNFAEMIRAMKK